MACYLEVISWKYGGKFNVSKIYIHNVIFSIFIVVVGGGGGGGPGVAQSVY